MCVGGGAGVSEFFSMNPNLIFFLRWGWGGGWRGREGG